MKHQICIKQEGENIMKTESEIKQYLLEITKNTASKQQQAIDNFVNDAKNMYLSNPGIIEANFRGEKYYTTLKTVNNIAIKYQETTKIIKKLKIKAQDLYAEFIGIKTNDVVKVPSTHLLYGFQFIRGIAKRTKHGWSVRILDGCNAAKADLFICRP